MTIQAIKTSIENRVLQLDSTFKKLSHVFTFPSNKFEAYSKRFSVVPGKVLETTTITRAVTFKQNFQVYLTLGYKTEHLNDDKIVECISTLQDFATDVIKSGYQDRFLNADIININDAKVLDGAIEHQYNIVIVQIDLVLTYRKMI